MSTIFTHLYAHLIPRTDSALASSIRICQMECLAKRDCRNSSHTHCVFSGKRCSPSPTNVPKFGQLVIQGKDANVPLWADILYCDGSTVLNVSNFGVQIFRQQNVLSIVIYSSRRLVSELNIQPCIIPVRNRGKKKYISKYRYSANVTHNYFNAKNLLRPELTICTQIDTRRIPSLLALAKMYTGPISVAIFTFDSQDENNQIHHMFTENKNTFERVAVHLVHGKYEHPFPRDIWAQGIKKPYVYPINELRNIAVEAALTEFILLIEGDMIFPSPTKSTLLEKLNKLASLDTLNGKIAHALLLPLYYPASCKESIPIPRDKQNLRKKNFHPCKYSSHGFMNYTKWELSNQTTSMVKLPRYWSILGQNDLGSLIPAFEPYFIIAKHNAPFFLPDIYCFGDKTIPLSTWLRSQTVEFYISSNFLVNIECRKRLNRSYQGFSLCKNYSDSLRRQTQIEYADMFRVHAEDHRNRMRFKRFVRIPNMSQRSILPHIYMFPFLAIYFVYFFKCRGKLLKK